MAVIDTPFGKDRPATSSESFIGKALTGGKGDSNEIQQKSIDRPSQAIQTAFAMDNVKLAMPVKSSIKDESWAGSYDNLSHSLTGSSAVQDKVGDKSNARKTIFPNH